MKKISKCEIEEKNRDEFNFEEHIYLFQYEGMIRKLIIDYKFNENSKDALASLLEKEDLKNIIITGNEKFVKEFKNYLGEN